MSREQMTDTFMKEEMSSMFSLAPVSLIIRFLVTVCALIRFLWQIADAYDGGKGDGRSTFSYYEPVKESQGRDELRFSFPANREYRITVIGASALIHLSVTVQRGSCGLCRWRLSRPARAHPSWSAARTWTIPQRYLPFTGLLIGRLLSSELKSERSADAGVLFCALLVS